MKKGEIECYRTGLEFTSHWNSVGDILNILQLKDFQQSSYAKHVQAKHPQAVVSAKEGNTYLRDQCHACVFPLKNVLSNDIFLE